MKTHRVILVAATLGISVLAMSSCVYEPYYPAVSRSYGYGDSSFSTLHFVCTSNPRWGYDPRVRCYYDYHRRCYYDPYKLGYYPVGYRPVYVRGVPHPHGWNGRHHHIAPPSRIRDYHLGSHYQHNDRYRDSSYDRSGLIQFRSEPRTEQTRRYSGYSPSYESRIDRSSGSFNERRLREDEKVDRYRKSRQYQETRFRQRERAMRQTS